MIWVVASPKLRMSAILRPWSTETSLVAPWSRVAPTPSRASTVTVLYDWTEDLGSHTICAVVTAEFLEHQRYIGNDLSTPMPHYGFPGLVPGDRWCVTAANWLRSHTRRAAAFGALASTHERALEIVPLDILRAHAVDVPLGPGDLQD